MSDRLRRAEEKVESALSDLESLLEFEEKVGHDLNASRKLRDTKKAEYDLLKKQCEDILRQDFGDDAKGAVTGGAGSASSSPVSRRRPRGTRSSESSGGALVEACKDITDAEVQILVDHVKKFAREEHEEVLAQIRDALRTNTTEERRNLLREISLEKRKANHPDAGSSPSAARQAEGNKGGKSPSAPSKAAAANDPEAAATASGSAPVAGAGAATSGGKPKASSSAPPTKPKAKAQGASGVSSPAGKAKASASNTASGSPAPAKPKSSKAKAAAKSGSSAPSLSSPAKAKPKAATDRPSTTVDAEAAAAGEGGATSATASGSAASAKKSPRGSKASPRGSPPPSPRTAKRTKEKTQLQEKLKKLLEAEKTKAKSSSASAVAAGPAAAGRKKKTSSSAETARPNGEEHFLDSDEEQLIESISADALAKTAPIGAATALTDDLDQLLADAAMIMTSPQLDDAAKEARTALLNLAKPLNKELKEFDRERWKEVVKQPRRRLQVFEAKSCEDDIYGVRAGLMPAPDEDLDFADGLGFGGGADRAGVQRDDPEDLGLGLGLGVGNGMDAAEAGPAGVDDALGATLTPKRAERGGLSSPRLLGSSSPAADRPGGSGAGKVKSGGASAANKSASPKSAKQAPSTPKVGKSKAAPKPSSASSSSASSSGPAVAGERAAPKTPAKPATTPTSKAKAKAATNPPGGARSSASSSATSPTAAAHKGSPTSFAKSKPPFPKPLPTTDEQKVIPFVEDLIDRLILPSVIAESLKKTLTQAEIEDKRKLHIKKLEQASGNANSPRGAGGKGLLSSPDEGVVKLTETELEAEAIPIIGTWIRDCAAREMWQLAQEMAQFSEEMQTLADYCIVTAALNPNAAGALHQAENWVEKPPADLSKFEQCVSVLSQMGLDMTKRKFRPSAPLDLDRRKTRMLTRAGSKEGVVADGSSRAEDGTGEGGAGGADEKAATSKDDDSVSATSFEEEVDVIPLKVADAPFYRVLNSKNRYSAKKAALLQASSANDAGPAANLNFANDPGLVDFYHAGGMGTTSFQLGAENLAAATSNVTAPDVASLGTSPTSGNTSLTNSPARLQHQFAARQAENATRAAVGDVGAQPPMVAASVGHGLGAEPVSPNSRRPRPHTFDPRKHGSWVEERRKFLRDRDPKTKEAISEFCSLDRNLRSTYTNGVDADANKGRISGFIAHAAVRYTRSLGLVLVLCTEKGYLGDNFLYVLRLPQKLPAPVVAGGSGGGGGTGVEVGTADGEEADGSGGGEMNRGESKNGNVNDLRARAGGAVVGNAVPSALAQASAKKKSKKKSDPMGANVDWSDFFEPKFVLLRESVSEKKWHSPQLSADGSTVICLEGEKGMAILCTSTFFQPEGFAANASASSSATGSQTGYVHSMHKALAIDASMHFRRNGQEEYAEENLWPRKATFFQGDMSLLGTNETALVGLADGSLVKLNMGGKAVQVLPGAVDFGTPGVERLPRFWDVPRGNFGGERKKEKDYEAEQDTWHPIPKEYFERHDSAIRVLGCTQTDSLTWSLDGRDLVCVWQYSEKQRTGFGSFRPLAAWRLNLEDYVLNLPKTSVSESGTDDERDFHRGAHTAAPANASNNESQPPNLRVNFAPDETNDDDEIVNEHFLYPFYFEQDHLYFPGANNAVYRVSASSFSKRRIAVLGDKAAGEDHAHNFGGGGRGDRKKSVNFDVSGGADGGSNSSDDDEDRHRDRPGRTRNDVEQAGGRLVEEQPLGDCVEDHLYGVKVPLLHTFPGYGKRTTAIEDIVGTSTAAAPSSSSSRSQVVDFAFFGKTAACLYRIKKNVFRCFVFSAETELPPASKQDAAFSTSGGRKTAHSPAKLALSPLLPPAPTSGGGTTGSAKAGSPASTPTNRRGSGFFGSMMNTITSPVTAVAQGVSSAAQGVTSVGGAVTGGITGALTTATRPATRGSEGSSRAGGLQGDNASRLASKASAPLQFTALPPLGTRSHKLLVEGVSDPDTDEEEELSYFTAAGGAGDFIAGNVGLPGDERRSGSDAEDSSDEEVGGGNETGEERNERTANTADAGGNRNQAGAANAVLGAPTEGEGEGPQAPTTAAVDAGSASATDSVAASSNKETLASSKLQTSASSRSNLAPIPEEDAGSPAGGGAGAAAAAVPNISLLGRHQNEHPSETTAVRATAAAVSRPFTSTKNQRRGRTKRRRGPAPEAIPSLPKLKFELPHKDLLDAFHEHNVGSNVDSQPRMAVAAKHYVWIVDEVFIYCFSGKTGQMLLQYRHGILDPELAKVPNVAEQNEDDDNGLLPNIVNVQIVNVLSKTRQVLLVATNHVVKGYWVPKG